jgi:transposase
MASASVVKLGGVPVATAPWVVSDALWERVEPLLPKVERRFRYPGRKRLSDRQALQGILFVLHTGMAWRHLPLELGFGGGSTCYRRLDEWQRAGVWERLHERLLAELHAAGEIEWSRAVADGSHLQAKKGAPRRARARLIEPETAPSTTSLSTRQGSRSPGVSRAATATTSPN